MAFISMVYITNIIVIAVYIFGLHLEGWDFCKSLTGYMRKYISQLHSGKYTQCVNCGVLIKPTNNRQKYCPTCWKERHKEQDREYQKRKYKKFSTFRKLLKPL